MNSQLLPDLLSVQAQAVVQRAKDLGLTWTLRPGVIDTLGTGPNVTYDGDTESLGAMSLVGEQPVGTRVMMLQVPPAGNYVLGVIGGGGVAARGIVDEVWLPTTSASFGTTQTIVITSNVLSFQEGRAYEVQLEGGADGNTANAMVDLRLYKGTTTATTIFELFRFPWTTAGLVVNTCCSRTFRVNADVTTAVSLGVSATAGTTRLFVATNTGWIMRIVDVGPNDLYTFTSVMP